MEMYFEKCLYFIKWCKVYECKLRGIPNFLHLNTFLVGKLYHFSKTRQKVKGGRFYCAKKNEIVNFV